MKSGWLIECGDSATPSYLGLNPGAERPEIMWTTNPYEAYVFPSKEIAQTYHDFFVSKAKNRVCWHEFE